jgi:hypothetical protein
MELKDKIEVHGRLTIKTIDGATGLVLNEDTGENCILDSGITQICRRIAGDSVYPVALLQLGANATPETVTDAPINGDGTLNASPSELFDVKAYFLTPGKTLFKCIVNLNEGNGFNSTGSASYNEAVLMYRRGIPIPNGLSLEYDWFARKTFSNKIKNSNLLFELNWEISFVYVAV